ncbi:MAG: alpha/beta fold hydrolase [Gemmatimonadota bacterium]
MTQHTLAGSDGHRLHYSSWLVDRPRGRVLVLHGLGEYGDRYASVARAANAAGCDAFALDQRGHGRSSGQRGHTRTLDGVIADVGLFRDRIEQGEPRLPTFLVGHSVGGLVALRYLQGARGRSVRGGILVAPFLASSLRTPKWKLRLGKVASRTVPFLAMDNGIPLEDQFRLPEERIESQTDRLTHRRITARMWSEMVRGADLAEAEAEAVACPLLIQLPGDDRIVSNEATLRLAERLAVPSDVIIYEGAFHDLYRDPERDRALADVTRWLQDKISQAWFRHTTDYVE